VTTLTLARQVIGHACGSMTTTLVYLGRRDAGQSRGCFAKCAIPRAVR